MSNVPEGAQISEDGQWWWDGENWQQVSQEGGQGGAAQGGEGGDRAQARADQGLPQTLEELSTDQLKQVMGEATVSVEVVEADETEVLAMNDNSNQDGNDNGGQLA
jgi:hypothetical protein